MCHGDAVAIALHGTQAMITGFLACHKIGAAYVPIDVQLPEQRLRYVLQDSQPANC